MLVVGLDKRAMAKDIGDVGLGIDHGFNQRCAGCEQRCDTGSMSGQQAIGVNDNTDCDGSLPVCPTALSRLTAICGFAI